MSDLDNAMKKVMSTPEGREVLWWVLDRSGLFSETFDVDPCVSAYKQGSRAVGRKLFAVIEKNSFDEFVVAREEYMTQRSKDEEDVNRTDETD